MTKNNYYTSTRDEEVNISAKEAIIKGFSDDKGLFVLPNLGQEKIDLHQLANQNYFQTAQMILRVLLPDFSEQEIKKSVQTAYHHKFTSEQITPTVPVDNFHILELFHGPTAAFKDVGLQLLPELMNKALNPQQRIMILAATSGDTGTAALAGFKNTDQMGITVFYPYQGVSPIQKQQMLTTSGNNTHVAAIKGNFDDAQTNVKKIFNDAQLKSSMGDNIGLSSANSINIGRLIPQIVYYFRAYQQLLNADQITLGDQISFTVPTGNFGDVLAGYYAKQLGLPIKKLVIACNSNKVLADFFNNGVYDRNRPFFKTVAPSMDIQISSNFERLLYYKSNGDAKYIQKLMNELETNGRYQVTPEILASIQKDFSCGFSTDEEIEASIKEVYQKYHYLMDPHTASGYKVMRAAQEQDPSVPMVLLSTASPYKFVDAVSEALNGHHESNPQVTAQKLVEETGIQIPPSLAKIWATPSVKEEVIASDQMTNYVEQQIEEEWK